jgi:hypothetical protein
MAVVLNERINKIRACYLLETFKFEDFISIYDGKKSDAKKEYDKIIKYLNMKVNDGNDYVKYNYSDKRHNGRLYGKDSIQGIKREIRGFICDEVTYDIDICNCHPELLLQLCLKHELHSPNLKQYINERKECLHSIMTDDNISYEEAKIKVLVATNDNKKIKTDNPFLKAYDKEMKEIQKKFLTLEDFAYVKEYAKKDVNFEGSFINHILCIHEEYALKAMRTFCAINELEIHSLMFDGLMVYSINEHTLKLMEEYIHKHTDFVNIKLTIKEHSYDFEMPSDFKPKERTVYEDVRSDFEKNNCKVGAEFVCDLHNDFNVYSDHSFKVLHNELTYIGSDGKEENFINTWYKDKNKRKYDKYDSYPKDSLCPDYVYNMWEKFPVELMPCVTNEYSKSGLTWFLNHINVMVDYNQIHADFVKMWIAQMFQYPENKTIHLIFIGLEGSGKGTFVKFFETIMGGSHRCWECTDPQEDIFGKFNDMMKKAFLVILNEADKSGSYNSNNKMKALITDKTINIRPKGKTSFVMKSCHRFMSFSNNPDPNTKLKRRDFTMRMSDCKIDNTNYFEEGNAYAKNNEVAKAIYDYFMAYQTKPIIVNSDIPVGIYDEMLKEAQKEPILEFLDEMVYVNQGIRHYGSNTLYENYMEFCARNHIPFVMPKMSFTTRLGMRHYNGLSKGGKWLDGRKQNVWTFDFDLLKTEFNVNGLEEDMMVGSDDEFLE